MNKTELKKKVAKKATKKTAKKTASKKKVFGPDVYQRDEHGLLKNIDYHFNEDGSVDWRAMIKPEFLYPNKGWFDMRGQPTPTSTEGLKDNQLLIMLGGIKELARLRGFHGVSFQVQNVDDGYVTALCIIDWIGNYESGSKDYNGNYTTVNYQDVANATFENTDSFCEKFLETIACNRAFVRCVRNFLNIHIVGADEIDKSNNRTEPSSKSSTPSSNVPITPSALLETKVKASHGVNSWDDFKELLRGLWKEEKYVNESVKDWDSFSDIPAKEARKLISIISK